MLNQNLFYKTNNNKMFSELIGLVKRKQKDSITLIVNNIGYLVNLSENVLEKIALGENLSFTIETKFKVDKIVLFGFVNEYQQFLFNKIGNISGVSDKIALNLSGFFAPQEIIHIINSENKENPFKINGLGAKTWEKIIFNLERDKNFIKECASYNQDTDYKTSVNTAIQNYKHEATSALIHIGIGKNLASELIEKAIKDKNIGVATTENLVKSALAHHYR